LLSKLEVINGTSPTIGEIVAAAARIEPKEELMLKKGESREGEMEYEL